MLTNLLQYLGLVDGVATVTHLAIVVNVFSVVFVIISTHIAYLHSVRPLWPNPKMKSVLVARMAIRTALVLLAIEDIAMVYLIIIGRITGDSGVLILLAALTPPILFLLSFALLWGASRNPFGIGGL